MYKLSLTILLVISGFAYASDQNGMEIDGDDIGNDINYLVAFINALKTEDSVCPGAPKKLVGISKRYTRNNGAQRRDVKRRVVRGLNLNNIDGQNLMFNSMGHVSVASVQNLAFADRQQELHKQMRDLFKQPGQ